MKSLFQLSYFKKSIILAVSSLAFMTGASNVHAKYPEKTVTIIVPFAAGGAADTLGRLMANKLSEKLDKPVIVENKPGAGTMLASQYVSRAKPDGYTLLLAASSLSTIPSIHDNANYDPVDSFEPLSQIASVVHVVSVNPELPVNSVEELVEYLKENGSKVNYASLGVGSSPQLEAELFKYLAKVDMQGVPYKGSAPALTDLVSNRVQVMFDAWASTGPFSKDGKVRTLAVTTDEPSPSVPDLKPIAETVPGFHAMPWLGLVAPKDTPAEVGEVIYSAIKDIVKEDDVKKKFKTLGLDVIASDPDTFKEFIKEDVKKWSKVIKEADITINKE